MYPFILVELTSAIELLIGITSFWQDAIYSKILMCP